MFLIPFPPKPPPPPICPIPLSLQVPTKKHSSLIWTHPGDSIGNERGFGFILWGSVCYKPAGTNLTDRRLGEFRCRLRAILSTALFCCCCATTLCITNVLHYLQQQFSLSVCNNIIFYVRIVPIEIKPLSKRVSTRVKTIKKRIPTWWSRFLPLQRNSSCVSSHPTRSLCRRGWPWLQDFYDCW
jgi:hypothetical protein